MTATARSEYRVRNVADRDQIAAFLRTDRLYAAYAIGDLDGPARSRAAWALAFAGDGSPVALAMHHEGLVPQPLFLMGDPDGCRAILESTLRPRDAYLQATEEHAAAISDVYDWELPLTMLRMVVDRDRFVPFAGPVERLGARDVEELNRLYQLGFRTGFPASVVEDGVYYGVRVGGALVSAAGTHVVNPREGIAVVGNVMTDTAHRGSDYAKMVTSAVTAELLTRLPDVALNVHTTNGPAIAAYARLGYRTYRDLSERLVHRRDGGWGLMRPIREALRMTWLRPR